MDVSFAIEVETVFGILDDLDYFQVLKLSPPASPREIKAAYYRESRIFHPDKVFHLGSSELGHRVQAIHKRITEAYTVLRDEASRDAYQARIQGADRALHLRWTVHDDGAQKKEAVGTTENGKKLYGAALADLEAGRFDAADQNLRMALVFEPGNQNYVRKVEEAAQLRRASLQAGSLSST